MASVSVVPECITPVGVVVLAALAASLVFGVGHKRAACCRSICRFRPSGVTPVGLVPSGRLRPPFGSDGVGQYSEARGVGHRSTVGSIPLAAMVSSDGVPALGLFEQIPFWELP